MEADKKRQSEQDLEEEQKKELEKGYETNASLFIKLGIIVLSIIMIIGFGVKIAPNAVTISTIGRKIDLPIYSVNTEERKVALSFDVSGDNKDTDKILAILSKHKVKTTFFITGKWVEEYPKEVKAIAAAGHDIGNHSENHMQMSQLSVEECNEEIMTLHDKVKEVAGINMNLFRAPYGEYNNTLVAAARDCGYYTIQWDVDSMDWKDYGVNSILSKTLDNRKLGNGSILLLHISAKYTAEALEEIIIGLQEKGYEIVPVSQLIYTGEYKVDQMGRQIEK